MIDGQEALETTEEAGQEEPQGSKQEQAQEGAEEELSWEDQAKTMGWKPLEEFKGNKAIFVDAEEFVRAGEISIPIMNANMRKMQRQLVSVTSDLAIQKDIARTDKAAALKRQRTEIEGQYDTAVLDAARDGDPEAVAKAQETRDAALAAQPVLEEATPASPYDVPLAEFKDRNVAWYGENQVMTDFADAEGGRVRMNSPNLSPDEELKEVEKAVRAAFPKEFGNPNRQRPAAVNSGRRPAGKAKTKTYAAMPPENREACDEMVLDGVKQADYVKNYWIMMEQEHAK